MTKCLVDTGAAVTVISEQFYHDVLHNDFPLKTNSTVSNVKTANGHTVPVNGFVSFPVVIGQFNVINTSVVRSLAYSVVGRT